jgi:hypothetical protein
MNSLQQLKTKKLFYGKWAYKVATICSGGSHIRGMGPVACKEKALAGTFNVYSYRRIDSPQLVDFCTRFENFVGDEYQVRYEGSHVNFFIGDRVVYEKIKAAMGNFVVKTWEPEDDTVLTTLLDNKKFVVVDQLPHGKYTSKVILKIMPLNQRERLVSLLKKYDIDKFRISKSTERYLLGGTHWMQDPFIYIEDEKMLTMLALAASGYIRKTEKFVVKSSINTYLEQEQTCQPLVKV